MSLSPHQNGTIAASAFRSGVADVAGPIPRGSQATREVERDDAIERPPSVIDGRFCINPMIDATMTCQIMRGFDGSVTTVNISSRASIHALVERATALGDVTGMDPCRRGLTVPGRAGDDPRG